MSLFNCSHYNNRNIAYPLSIYNVNCLALDEMTALLLRQSAQQPLEQVHAAEIERVYIEQAMQAEWNEQKHSIVLDSINALGIRPGHGKWA